MSLYSPSKTASDKAIPATLTPLAVKPAYTTSTPPVKSGFLPGSASGAKSFSRPNRQNPTAPQKPSGLRFRFGKTINSAGLAEFTRQLATLVNAGMPILRSLDTLARQEPNPAFKWVIAEISDSIRSGGSLSDGLGQHPRIFDHLYINMVKAGEASGSLGAILERLASFMEKAEKIKGKVKAAMAYPIVILGVAALIVSALMVFVIPRFQEVFNGLLRGVALPALTQAVIGASHLVQQHLFETVGLIALSVFAFKMTAKTRSGRSLLDWIQLKAPVFGPLVLKASISRFSRTLGTLLASGVPILQAILIARDTSGNVHIAAALEKVHGCVKQGDGVGGPLEATRIFPSMVSSLVEIGEETGSLPDMLNRIADIYESAVDNAVNAITSIIEPIMIVFMAVVVGTIVIALFLPLISIITHLAG
ncbi:MAG: hypothetical protein RIQ79_1559 [Verrucomicrobiota bacterium]